MAVNTAVDFLTFVIEEIGIFAVGATVVGWVARDLISQHFDKELNRYQTELEKDKLRFSKLHTQRAEITAELYERFVEFEEDMRSLTDPVERPNDPSKDEKLKTAAESGNSFIGFYMKNKIYFPPHICETIEGIHRQMDHAFTTVKRHGAYDDRPPSPEQMDGLHDSWERVTRSKVPELKSDLEDHFRGLLGVEFERDNDASRGVETTSETETAKE